jgi:hypothetical protein
MWYVTSPQTLRSVQLRWLMPEVIDAVMVREGARSGQTALMQSVQWFSSSVGYIIAALSGGALAGIASPRNALHRAVFFLLPLPLLNAALPLLIADSPRVPFAQVKFALSTALRSSQLRGVVLFLGAFAVERANAFVILQLTRTVLWNFSPGFGTAW